eukprot:XP_012823427.1 PREDICTED: inositol polyphosphate 1-phosphatase isoform X1 [Xenopus tropicalis]
MLEILQELLRASEKAACIARACRQEETLFQLLIEEKKDGEKNKKFLTDFKTLADVLVQEVIRHDMGEKFPGLEKNIAGEESNTFTNELGEKVVVQICQTEEETGKLLQTILNNEAAAKALAKAAHEDVELSVPAVDNVILNIPYSKIGMWVDPIDSTYQYIKGFADTKTNNGIYSKGLQCVTVLIGVFLTDTGLPIMGVINQPFATRDKVTLRWKSHVYWGLSYMDINICSLNFSTSAGTNDETNYCTSDNGSAARNSYSAVTSSAEAKDILNSLSRVCGKNVYFAAGAGYKCLCVILGLVDFYVFSEDTTFKWDCCAPHAILKSLGGGILDLSEYLESIRQRKSFSERPHLVYNVPVKGAVGADLWANTGGVVAYRSDKHLEHFMDLFVKKLPFQNEPC